ncbi:MAG: hypothetical protein KY469_07100 [Actinobacteria bacterium]|nr:hypothetical protein [Actinomycetota bacterium]
MAYWAYGLLRAGFGVAPILFGLDKFFNLMVEWQYYLWDGVVDALPWTAQEIMYGVGVIEIAAGLLVLFAPRIGAPLVAFWLGTIVVNLVVLSWFGDPVEPIGRTEYWDIALRDFGLMIGAIALSLLAWQYAGTRPRS